MIDLINNIAHYLTERNTIMDYATPLAQPFTIRTLLRFAAPSIGMMLVISLYTITDGIFIGQFAGSNALAASNIVYPPINLLYGLGIMLASGGSALVAKTLGEKKRKRANAQFTLITASGAATGAALALLIYLFFEPVLRFLGAAPELMADCRSYLGAVLPFFPAAALLVIFNAFYIADGRPIQGFLVSVASGIANAALDYLFLACLGMGITGAGLATGLADLLAAAIGLVYFARYSRTLHFARFAVRLSVLRDTCSNGLSELVTQLSMGVITFLFNLLTLSYAGADGVAAITVILYAEMLLSAVFMGFTNGVAPVFSYHFGARHPHELVRLLKLSLVIIFASGLFAFGAAQILAAPLIHLFLPQGGNAARLTESGFALFSFSFLLSGFNIFGSGFFTALSNGKTSAIISFVRNLAATSLFLAILPCFFALSGVWLAVPAADIAALLLTSFCLRREAGTLQNGQLSLPAASCPGTGRL